MRIEITVADRKATLQGTPVLVCGNSTDRVAFTFDSEWSAYTDKTARFVYIRNGKVTFQDMPVAGDNSAAIPKLANITEVHVGVYSDDIITTTPAVVPCEKSIKCGTGEPDVLTPSQYDQIMEMFNEFIENGGGANIGNIELGYNLDGKLYVYSNGEPISNGITGVYDNIKLEDVVSYYQEPTKAVADEVNALGGEYISFIAVADTHGAYANMQRSQNIIRYLLKYSKAKKFINLGDMVSSSWVEEEFKSWFAPFANCLPQVFVALGNHDKYGSTYEDNKVIYDDILADKRFLKGSPEFLFYHFDDEINKIRYVVINTSDLLSTSNYISAQQKTWLQECVHLPTSQWKLLVFGHIDIMPNDPITDAYNYHSAEDVSNIIASTNGSVIGYFCGHEHHDRIVKVNDSFYQITLLNDNSLADNSFPEIPTPERVRGTVSEHAVSVISVNTVTGDVTIRRIGAGENMSYKFDIKTAAEATLTGISATYTGGAVPIGSTLESLTGLTVTAIYSDGSTTSVTDYELSGEIAEGANTITVTYEGQTTTFTVTGVRCSGETEWFDGVPYVYECVEGVYVGIGNENKGEYIPYADWQATPLLYCYGAKEIRMYTINGDGNSSAYYDADKNCIQGKMRFTAGTDYWYSVVPEGACYFAYSEKKLKADTTKNLTPSATATT